MTEIEARFGTGAIYGTRLAGSSDMSFLTVEELKTFKKITGGDSLFAEFKGQQGFEFTYGGLLWFCMNRLPKFGGDDGKWVYNRIMAVNCPNAIPKDKQDKLLLEKMYAEREGIVYQAVMALQTVIKNGYRFSEPQSIEVARETYRAENNTVISFLPSVWKNATSRNTPMEPPQGEFTMCTSLGAMTTITALPRRRKSSATRLPIIWAARSRKSRFILAREHTIGSLRSRRR